MDAPSAFALLDTASTAHDTRFPSVFAMPSLEQDHDDIQSSEDDSDVAVAPVPVAAYAPPSVYRCTQRDDTRDYDSMEKDGLINDSEDDSSYEPERENTKNSDDDEMNSLFTDVGNEIEMLSSPSGTTPFDQIDLTISMESADSREQETQALFSDESEDVEDPSAQRVL